MELSAGNQVDFAVGRGFGRQQLWCRFENRNSHKMKTYFFRIALMLASSLATTVQSATTPQAYDIQRDFSVASNPNGVWSYGYYASIGGTFTLMNTARTNEVPSVPIWSWSVGGISPPDVHFNAGTNIFMADGGTFPPGSLWICPGPEGTTRNYGVMRFTVPPGGAGSYRVETAVQPYVDGALDRDSDFHVARNGVELFGIFLAPHSSSGYTNQLVLGAGDTVDFVIGRGQDGLLTGSCLKLRAVLTPAGAAPAPDDYDLSRDYSATNNPGGPWAYGAKPSLGGPLSIFGIRGTTPADGGIPIEYWQLLPLREPTIFHNGTTNTATITGGQGTLPPGTTYLVSGTDGVSNGFGAVRFTAPVSGSYSLQSSARPLFNTTLQGDTDYHVVKNGTELFGVFLSAQQGSVYSNTISLVAGDTIDFMVGRGADNSGYASGLKIDARLGLATNAAPPCSNSPAGLISWWTGEDTPNDQVGTNHAALRNGTGYGTGLVGRGFRFDGINDDLLVADAPSLDLTNEFTIELWFRKDQPWVPNVQFVLFDKRDSSGHLNYGASLSVNYGLILYYQDPSAGDFQILSYNPLPTTNVFHHFAGVYQQVDPGHVQLRSYLDGQQVAIGLFPGNLANALTASPLTIGSARGCCDFFQGVLDEISIYRRALTGGEVATIFAAASAGKCLVNAHPDVSLLSPTNGSQLVYAPILPIVATAVDADGAVQRVEFFDGTNRLGALESAPFVFAWSNAALGVHQLSAVAVDNHGAQTVSGISSVNVIFVNVAPTFTAGANQVVPEDAPVQTVPGWARNISAGPSFESGQRLTFIVSNDTPALFSAAPAIDVTGTLIYAPAPDAHGSALVTVWLRDDGGVDNTGQDTSSPHSFTIQVGAVNDAPIAFSEALETDEDTPLRITLTGSDADGDSLSFVVVTLPLHGILTGSGAVRNYVPAADYFGPDSFTFTTSDGRTSSVPATIRIQVRPVDDAPVAVIRILSPLLRLFPDETDLILLAPNSSNLVVVLDGSFSRDTEDVPLEFVWLEHGIPFATGPRITNQLAVGEHTVSLHVTDGTKIGSVEVSFSILSLRDAIELVIEHLNDSDLGSRNLRPLIASLKAAMASFDRGNQVAGLNQLNACQNKIRVQLGSRDPVLATSLIEAIQRILEQLDR